MPHGPYAINFTNQALPTGAACTLLQYKAGASNPAYLVRAQLSARGSGIASNQITLSLLRKSAAATVTSFTPLLLNTIDPAAAGVGGTAATGWNVTTGQEGTDGDILVTWNPNVLSGWQDIPIPEGRIYIPVSGILGLKLMAGAPVGVSCDAVLHIVELP